MKLAHYSPTFRNVLLQEVKITKTKGGIILPSTEYATGENNKLYLVLKAGKDCIEVKPGYLVKIMEGLYPAPFKLEWDALEALYSGDIHDGDHEVCQVMEQQIIGYYNEE